jgi:hypothetical protein
VTSRGVPIAAGEATVAAPTAPTTAPAGGAGSTPGPTLPATGQTAGDLGALGTTLVVVGAGALVAAAALARRWARAAE